MNKQVSLSISIMRVVGMLFVALGNHFIPRYYPGFIPSAISQYFGFVGVGMFFAVSGYLFGTKAATDHNVGCFRWLYKRAKRILIPYGIILLGVILVRVIRNNSISWQNVAVSVLNLQGILQLQYAFPELGHTWFISILMVCYILICVWVRMKDNRLFWILHWFVYALAIAVFAAMNQITSASYTGSILLFSFMFYCGYRGILNVVIRGSKSCLLPSLCAIIVMLSLRAFVWILMDDTPLYIVTVVLSGFIAAISFFCFVVSMVNKYGIIDIPKPIQCLNDLSYEFYLVHAVFISGSTSLYGIVGDKAIEIIALLCISLIFAYAVRKASQFIIQRG